MRNIRIFSDFIIENNGTDQRRLNRELLDAAMRGDAGLCRNLLDRGADIETRSKKPFRMTPLHLACMYGNSTDVVRLLLDRGASIEARDGQKFTPLHVACTRRNMGIIRLLIDEDADIEARDAVGNTPLYWARGYSNERSLPNLGEKDTTAVRILIERGADPFTAFKDAVDIIKFFGGDIGWMPEGLRLKLERARKAHGLFRR